MRVSELLALMSTTAQWGHQIYVLILQFHKIKKKINIERNEQISRKALQKDKELLILEIKP